MDPARDDHSGLRSALSSLKPLLTKLGLEQPSRLGPYIPTSDCHAGRLTAYEYLRESTKKVLLQYELKGRVEVAVLSFVDLVLDDEAPPMVLPCFMHALFLANNHPTHRPNKGAWRVHDILKMASFYIPLQQALIDFTKDRQTTDLSRLLYQLRQHALLQQTALPDVLEALGQEGGVESAVVLLLAYVYDAARLELVHNRRRCVQSPPVWLETLLQCVERWAGINQECSLLRERIPPSVLSADGWKTVCEETQSEAGDSDISNFTLENCDNYNDKSQRKTNDVDQKLLGLNILEPEEEAFHESRQQRTAQYVLDTSDECRRPPSCLELVEHGQRTAETNQLESQDRAPAVSHRADRDESGSVITEVSSASTENNSHVVTDSLVVDRGQQDPGVRDIARTLAYIGLSDVPDNGPGQITLRAYQKELFQYAKDGKNVIVVLPTGTGKTFIVIKYVQEYLNNYPGSHRRVVFLAPKVKLVEQQYRRFLYFFPHTTCYRTGKSRSSSAPLSELINIYQVFVMTPMCLLEAIRQGDVKITDFSVLILDECHQTRAKNDFKALMDVYMDAKFAPAATGSPRSPLPQVIGLTASPGVGRGGSLPSAVTYLKELCFSMDVEKIGTVKRNVAELKRFINKPRQEIHTCRERTKNSFKRIIEGMMETIERDMINCPYVAQHADIEQRELLRKILTPPDLHRGLLRYTQWACGLDKQFLSVEDDNKDAYTKFFSSAEMLLRFQRYQKCLIINEDCESCYALQYLQGEAREMEEFQLHVDKQLLNHFKEHLPALERACKDSEDFNPKLRMLEDILLTMIDKNQDECACMVFVRTIELSLAIQRWIQGHEDLKQLNPGRIIGGTRPGGITQAEMSDVLENFNKGVHKLVVCTSAAEEGLDFQACNVVVRYAYVTNMISMIQTRGRARRFDSQYCVLGSMTHGSVDKEKGNQALERLMNKAIEEVQNQMDQNPNDFLLQMSKWQESEWNTRCRIAEQTRRKRHLVDSSAPTYQLLCRKCQCKACLSTDLRLLRISNRLVIASDFKSKWKRVELKCRPDNYQFNLEKVAKVHCKECSFDWGSVVKHKPSDAEYPLLKLESFFLLDTSTGKKIAAKVKWAHAPFNVEKITDDELFAAQTR